MADDGGVLYLVVSGAPAPESISALITACQAAGWRVVVFSTPTGTKFVDASELEKLTGEPVRSEYRIRRKVTGRTKTEVREKLKKLQAEADAGLKTSASYTVAKWVTRKFVRGSVARPLADSKPWRSSHRRVERRPVLSPLDACPSRIKCGWAG